MDKNKPILIIGAHGTLGRPVTRRLVQERFMIRALARSPDRARGLLPTAVDVVRGDLESVETLDKALQDCQAAYLSVETKSRDRFAAETDGLKNLITAMGNHRTARLIVLSAFQSSKPAAETHPWWHARLKHEAQKIARASGLPWTILEPTWFMESLPLFIKNKTFLHLKGARVEPYWLAGDDMGKIIANFFAKDLGQEEIIPLQGLEKLTLLEAAQRFIRAYDPTMKIRNLPLWVMGIFGIFSSEARDLKTLLQLEKEGGEPPPNAEVWHKFGKPSMTIEAYAGYCRGTADFPQK